MAEDRFESAAYQMAETGQERVYRAVEAARVVLRRPALSPPDFRERLQASGLPKTAQRMARIGELDDG